MNRKKFIQIGLIGSFFLVAVAYWFGSKPTTPIEIPQERLGGGAEMPAPPFRLPEHRVAKEHSLEDYQNKIVLVNFWASWCPPCIEEMPSLLVFSEWASRELGLVILAPSVDEDVGSIDRMFAEKKFWPTAKLPFTILIDTQGKVAAQYGVQKFPETFVVKNGKILRRFDGAQDWNSKEIRQWFSELFK